MLNGLLGRKIGMTQLFEADGRVVPVTVVIAGPCVVVQHRTRARDGYDAVQLGLVEKLSARRVTGPRRGHFAKAGVPPCRVLGEFAPTGEGAPEIGATVGADLFKADDYVDVSGISRGKGFAGVVKRHGFGGGARSHGSMFHRAPGSIGSSAFPSRVFKGMRAAGHMGARRATVKNLKVVRVDAERNLLFLRGAVPGAPHGTIALRRARRG